VQDERVSLQDSDSNCFSNLQTCHNPRIPGQLSMKRRWRILANVTVERCEPTSNDVEHA
jgi:hypothetical protein